MPDPAMLKRCPWCLSDPDYIAYHDQEWGVPCFDDHHLFAMLCLEGMQAGLNWLTILKRRDNYYAAFDQFDPIKIAAYQPSDIDRLMLNSGIIRQRKKIHAIITNARAFLTITATQSFASYLWAVVDGKPIVNTPHTPADIPNQSLLSQKLATQLKKDGFVFVGAISCYAFMQAIGMVNDHLLDCAFRRADGVPPAAPLENLLLL